VSRAFIFAPAGDPGEAVDVLGASSFALGEDGLGRLADDLERALAMS
jgi:hypothetical protein